MEPRNIRLVLAALLLACVVPQASLAAGVGVACEGLTKLEGCVECTNSGGVAKCFACHKDRGPSWAQDGRVTECRTTTVGQAARVASGDPNCNRADGQWCIECNRNFFFDASFKCVTSAQTGAARTAEICQKTSRNPDCAACSPDGTCTRCRNNLILVPLNAMFINAHWAESRCMTLANLNTEARNITWGNAAVPTGCIEVDSEFKCNRCRDGSSLTGGTCKLVASGNKCATTLAYRQYCAQCNAAGTACTQCNGSRGVVNGACSLPCRQLYGIGCRRCNGSACAETDPNYANGRR